MDFLDFISRIGENLNYSLDIKELGQNSRTFNAYLKLFSTFRYISDNKLDANTSADSKLIKNEITKITEDFSVLMEEEFGIKIHLKVDWI
ncbi:MAG: hypothetical protein J5798_09160 [Spirochaetaceae bacterium]|nr:hypothetical protein [Spirochaetaceae bacterium]